MANELISVGGGNVQQQQQQDFGPRVKGATIVKPIVFGNVARYFGHKRNNGHTHEWKVYLRLYNNEDSSGYIKKVQFKLHDSYATQIRVCNEPPYEVDETGWGEFEVVIKIYFVDPSERPVTIYHMLKLFKIEPGAAPGGGPMPVFTDYLVSEFYDELIFSEPSTTMMQLLKSAPPLPPSIRSQFETDFEEKKNETLQAILSAKNKIGTEIDDLKHRIQTAKDEIAKHQSNLI
ncbi:YEATS domain-containing protein 4 Gas41 [Dermatophagoides farinae]|uniref:YEATS domain-containing protein 4 n=1 Tax=Dermatophagoides farinae TaxID=6954 RepID=A0A922L3Q3_DERFA|nr:YEATS domain-containing protein 4-like [Dermatophagoides farinae]KAH7646672.1 yeats domain-containing protein 4-like protein [Dermatophagoides farinae]KAH9517228.1 YEATS domain-containing protein 4 [Dermatophagoides farinae]